MYSSKQGVTCASVFAMVRRKGLEPFWEGTEYAARKFGIGHYNDIYVDDYFDPYDSKVEEYICSTLYDDNRLTRFYWDLKNNLIIERDMTKIVCKPHKSEELIRIFWENNRKVAIKLRVGQSLGREIATYQNPIDAIPIREVNVEELVSRMWPFPEGMEIVDIHNLSLSAADVLFLLGIRPTIPVDEVKIYQYEDDVYPNEVRFTLEGIRALGSFSVTDSFTTEVPDELEKHNGN